MNFPVNRANSVAVIRYGRDATKGSAMADGFSVDRAALNETAQGINSTIGALKGVGIDETAEVGRCFSGLTLSGLQAGDAGLAAAFGNFCDRWSWGVRTLVQDGNQFAVRLGISAGVYADAENYLVGAAKNVSVALAGDPHMTDQQAAPASWSQDAAQVTGAQPPGGSTTWSQAGSEAAQQWKAVGRTAADGPDGIVRAAAGLTGNTAQLNQEENQLFGPPPSGSDSGGAG
jgi:hypothetical protein